MFNCGVAGEGRVQGAWAGTLDSGAARLRTENKTGSESGHWLLLPGWWWPVARAEQ